ncbi:MAG: hypothetical protein LV479_13410 [Methylacidiphilales bacterium]|nr:hypothetical protein [Candidatus Methylacidiphilales bacterium]
MSRNRMKDSQSLHWMGVVKWILIAGLLAGLGLCYMLCKNQNLHLAEETLRLQKQLDSIEARNTELADDLEGMKSMPVLRRRLDEMHSNLIGWSDPRATWLRLDQNTRARVANMGTIPQASFNFNSSVVAATAQTTH